MENILRGAPCDVLLSTRLEVPRIDVRPEETIRWTPEAEARMKNVPEQVKGIARTGVLRLALEKGHSVITNAVIDDAMDRFVMSPTSNQLVMLDKAGAPVTKQSYEWAGGFSEGLAAARSDGMWGFVDHNGAWSIRPAFADARGFWHGLAQVAWKDGYGYIDKKGRTVWKTAR